MGRRFPSIRVKDKKAKKKKDASNCIEYSNTVGSCARPVSAIYGTLDYNSSEKANIYENGHIILRQRQKSQQNWFQKCCCQKPALLTVIILSFAVFLTAGGVLLYQSCKL